MTHEASESLTRHTGTSQEIIAKFHDGSLAIYRTNGITAPTCHTVTKRAEILEISTAIEMANIHDAKAATRKSDYPPPNPSHAPNTRKSYRACWNGFVNWCRRAEAEPAKATTQQIANFLTELAESGLSKATVAMHRAAVKSGLDNLVDPERNPAEAKRIGGHMKLIASRYGKPQKQAPPMSAEDLQRIRDTACQPRTLPNGRKENPATAYRRGIMDIAIASLMRDGLLRVSEASAAMWEHLEMRNDGTSRLLIPRSKTDQTATGRRTYVSEETTQDLLALKTSRNGQKPADYIFGITAGRIAIRLKQAALHAGIQANITGHSPRVGMAQDLAADGTELPALMTAGGWQSPVMPARYIENIAVSRGAVAQYHRKRKSNRPPHGDPD